MTTAQIINPARIIRGRLFLFIAYLDILFFTVCRQRDK
jgi:hypothetical protein